MRLLHSFFLPLLLPSLSIARQSSLPFSSTAPSLTTLDPKTSARLLALHKSLVEIQSITSNEHEVAQWLAAYLRSENWTVELQKVSAKRYNVFAYGDSRDTTVLLSSHIDTVPPFWPYYYNESTGIIGGRGSVDAKGSVAAQIIAAEALRAYLLEDISLLYVVGEETGGDGMRAFSSWAKRPTEYDMVVFGEPTEGKLVCGHKGILSVLLSAHGKAAHSGYPWLGSSANDVLIDALVALIKLREVLPWSEKFGNTTLNVGRVEGGVAANVVAEEASATVAIRIAAGTPGVVRGLIEGVLKPVTERAHAAGANLTISYGSEGYAPVDMSCSIPGFETMTVNYGTDVPNLSGGHKKFLYGPGSIFVAHSDHEALKKSELEEAVLGIRRIVVEGTKVGPKEEQVEL